MSGTEFWPESGKWRKSRNGNGNGAKDEKRGAEIFLPRRKRDFPGDRNGNKNSFGRNKRASFRAKFGFLA